MPPNLRASQSTVHRAQFLDALVKLVPSGWAHFDKRLVNIEDKTAEGGSLFLNFKDGTTVEADSIIGADGIHSHTRAHVLDDLPDKGKYRLQYSGAVVYRSVIPMEKVVQALGTDIAQYSSLFMMDGAMMVSYPVDHNERLNAAAYTWEHKTWDKKEWVAPVNREEVLSSYRGMQPLDPKINELLNVSDTSNPSTAGLILTSHPHHSSSNPPPPGQSGTSPTSPNTTAARSASWAAQPTPPAPSTAREPGKPSKTPSPLQTSLRMESLPGMSLWRSRHSIKSVGHVPTRM
jgi:salicylate hydroxylase